MPYDDRLTTAEIKEAFAEEVAALGGTVADCFDDGERLFARSVLHRVREVSPGDRVQDGVALRAADGEVWIHPYVFRQVCSNGAILAHALQTRGIDDIDALDPDRAASAIREAVRACGDEESFSAAVEQMRSASEVKADLALTLMPLLTRFGHRDARTLCDIVERFVKGADSSRFGLLNAVTSLARDTSDPDARWRLESLGGAILSGHPPTPPSGGRHTKSLAEDFALIA